MQAELLADPVALPVPDAGASQTTMASLCLEIARRWRNEHRLGSKFARLARP